MATSIIETEDGIWGHRSPIDEPTSPKAAISENNDQGHYQIPSLWDIILEHRLVSIPPPLQICETKEDREYVDWLLEQHWDPAKSRAFLNQHEEDVGKEFTYGEVTPCGVRQLMEDMELLTTTTPQEHAEPVVFVDLGSGEGKCAIQVLLETLTTSKTRVNLQKVVGIELSPARHAMAEYAWKELQTHLLKSGHGEMNTSTGSSDACSTSLEPEQRIGSRKRLLEKWQPSHHDNKKKLQLVHANLLDFDFSDATHIYASSIFFPSNVLEEMSKKIIGYSNTHGKIKMVAALSDLELLEQADATTGTCRWEKRVQRLQMSWGGAYVRLYIPKDY